MTISPELVQLVCKELDEGIDKKTISQALNISLRSIYSINNNERKIKSKRITSIAKEKIRKNIKSAVDRIVKKGRRVTSTEVSRNIKNSPSAVSIRRHLKDLNLKYRNSAKHFILNDSQMKKRVEIARQWICEKTDWNKIVFSDESRFSLDGNDSFMTWKPSERQSRSFGGGSLMIWGCMNFDGNLIVRRVSTTINSDVYIKLLFEDVFDELKNKMQQFIFQQDNARVHVSRKTLSKFEQENIKLLPWPASSPDLSPIENVWSILKRRVYNGSQFKSKDDLWLRINEEVQKINESERSMINKLHEGFLKRICDILCSGGKILNVN